MSARKLRLGSGPALQDSDPVVIFEHAQLFNPEAGLPQAWTADIAHAALAAGTP